MENKPYVCPAEAAGLLDNRLRRIFQNPQKILKPFIKKGDTVIDLGCGPGFFTVEMAKMTGEHGTVIAVDIQTGMLEKVRNKIQGTEFEDVVKLHLCKQDSLELNEKADFILAFYMVHEIPDQQRFWNEIKRLMKTNTRMLIVEPYFHVPKNEFKRMKKELIKLGFSTETGPGSFFNRTLIIKK